MAAERFPKSMEWLKRAEARIPGASQTFSKGPTQFVRGGSPLFVERARGARVWDVDGHSYLDFTMGLCAVTLGYADPDVNAAVARQLERGVLFTLPHPLEAEVAERLCGMIPCAEMVRFGKNGSDATSGAVRLARAFTGREVIVACGYHGWQDWYIGTTTRNLGVPKAVRDLTRTFAYNRIETLEQVFDEHPGQVAAVIMEPVGVEEPRPGFLEAVRELCTRHGALLIFDEIVTGFRLALGGAQEHFQVVPDLACFGKGMSNGFPLAALVGRREIMRLLEEVFFSFTAGGETASLAACLATIEKMERRAVIPHLWRQGEQIRDHANRAAEASGVAGAIRCLGLGPRSVMTFTTPDGGAWWELKSLFQQECIRRELLFTGAHNMAFAHGDGEVSAACSIYDEVFPLVAKAVRRGDVSRRLEGPPVEPVFRQP
ncbi:MAG: aminotransferase class III-fold pyridoxal phosphate-dependent enzyme [Candidatus Rokuibacteriota bacterium]